MAYADTWSIRPLATDDDFFFASAAVGAAGALTLLKSELAINGAGRTVTIYAAGDSRNMTFTIVGAIVGQTKGTTTEVVTGPNATTATSTNYWARVDSVTASAAATGNVKVGFSGSLALPRCRIRGVHYVGTASAGSIKVNINATTGTEILGIDTPASATFAEYVKTNHILVGRSAAQTDFGIVTATNVTYYTLFLS